jgi:predicted lipoprotein with Yx(FWY)xxD motif
VKRLLLIIAAVGLIAVAVAACGGDDDSDDGAAPEAAAQVEPAAQAESKQEGGGAKKGDGGGAAPKPAGTTVQLAESQFGEVLFGPGERAIYLFDKESSSRSECYGACAEAWPPVLTEGAPQAGSGLEASLLGTTERSDGGTQVTYNGHPLYYYVDDPPGQVLCHNVEEFGGLWLVLDSGGNALP